MQVICTLALHHPLTAVSHEVTLRYVEQMQHSSLSCFAVGHTSSSMSQVHITQLQKEEENLGAVMIYAQFGELVR